MEHEPYINDLEHRIFRERLPMLRKFKYVETTLNSFMDAPTCVVNHEFSLKLACRIRLKEDDSPTEKIVQQAARALTYAVYKGISDDAREAMLLIHDLLDMTAYDEEMHSQALLVQGIMMKIIQRSGG